MPHSKTTDANSAMSSPSTSPSPSPSPTATSSPPKTAPVDVRPRSVSALSDTGSPDGSPRSRTGSRARTFSASSIGNYSRAVVLALDASDHAKYAFEWFLDNIHRPDDLIILVHCPEAPRLPSFSFKSPLAPPIHEWKEILDEMNTRTRRLEEDYEGTCIQRKLKYKIRGEAQKNPGEGIVRIAEDERCALICMGTRGLGTVRRALIGSVSDYVIRNSSIPVVIVPKRK